MKQHCLFHFLHFDLMNQNMLPDMKGLHSKYSKNPLSFEFAMIRNNNHSENMQFHPVQHLSKLARYHRKCFHQNLYYHSKHILPHLLLDLPKHFLQLQLHQLDPLQIADSGSIRLKIIRNSSGSMGRYCRFIFKLCDRKCNRRHCDLIGCNRIAV